MLENTKNKLSKEKLTIGQIIIIAVGIIVFSTLETNLFRDLSDIVKIIIYISLMIITASLGISFIDLKELGSKFKEIILNSELDAEGKVREFTNLAIMVLSRLGDAWELFQNEQFNGTKKDETPKDAPYEPNLDPNLT